MLGLVATAGWRGHRGHTAMTEGDPPTVWYDVEVAMEALEVVEVVEAANVVRADLIEPTLRYVGAVVDDYEPPREVSAIDASPWIGPIQIYSSGDEEEEANQRAATEVDSEETVEEEDPDQEARERRLSPTRPPSCRTRGSDFSCDEDIPEAKGAQGAKGVVDDVHDYEPLWEVSAIIQSDLSGDEEEEANQRAAKEVESEEKVEEEDQGAKGVGEGDAKRRRQLPKLSPRRRVFSGSASSSGFQ